MWFSVIALEEIIKRNFDIFKLHFYAFQFQVSTVNSDSWITFHAG